MSKVSNHSSVHSDYAWTITLVNTGIIIVGAFGAINKPANIVYLMHLVTVLIAAFSGSLLAWVWWFLKRHFSAYYTKDNNKNTFVYCSLTVSLWALNSSGYFYLSEYWLPLWSVLLSTMNSCFFLRFLYLLNIENKPKEVENYELLLSNPLKIIYIGVVIASIESFFFFQKIHFFIQIDIVFSFIILLFLWITFSEVFRKKMPLMTPFLGICVVLTFAAITMVGNNNEVLFLGIWSTGMNENILFYSIRLIYKILLIFIFFGLALSWPFFIRTIEAINANRTIDHRVKNSLNKLSAEFTIRSSHTPSEVLEYMRKKITAMNALHELLSKRNDRTDHESIANEVSGKKEFREYIMGLTSIIESLFKSEGITIVFDYKAVEPKINLDTDFTSKIGEVIYELVANSVKHHARYKPAISQHILCNQKKLTIRHTDNGPGVTYEQLEQSAGLGAWLMKDTVKGYGGEMSVFKDKNGITIFEFSFLITNIL